MLNNTESWTALGVPDIIAKTLLEQNFYSPTTIQALSIPPAILGHRDILGAAETGSGKTLAFGIPIINGILELQKKKENIIITSSGKFKEINKDEVDTDEDNEINCNSKFECKVKKKQSNSFTTKGIGLVNVIEDIDLDYTNVPKIVNPLYALILTPTRELATQIKNHLSKITKFTSIKIAVVVGGLAAVKQERILSKGPEIVIATPGRLWELINEGNPHLSQIDSIRYLVIDETDRMLEKGHFLELHKIIEKINSKESQNLKRQTFLFSATLTLDHDVNDRSKKRKTSNNKLLPFTHNERLQKLIATLKIKHPKIIDVTKDEGTTTNLTECRIICTMDYKDYYLYYFLKRYPGRTIIFCNSIGCVRRLVTLCGILNCNPLPLHASMPQRQRLKNLEKFQADSYGLLIATDVAARGLDIPCIEHVIHYQVPRTCDSYIHRSGRTARAARTGITILIMEPSEKQLYIKLCKTLNRTEDLPIFPVIDQLLEAVKERVNIARVIDKLELDYHRQNSQKGWIEKAAKEMDILLDDEPNSTTNDEDMADLKHQLKMKRKYLSSLMKKPIFPDKISGNYLDKSLNNSINESSQKAVDLMKTVIDENSRKKKRPFKHNLIEKPLQRKKRKK